MWPPGFATALRLGAIAMQLRRTRRQSQLLELGHGSVVVARFSQRAPGQHSREPPRRLLPARLPPRQRPARTRPRRPHRRRRRDSGRLCGHGRSHSEPERLRRPPRRSRQLAQRPHAPQLEPAACEQLEPFTRKLPGIRGTFSPPAPAHECSLPPLPRLRPRERCREGAAGPAGDRLRSMRFRSTHRPSRPVATAAPDPGGERREREVRGKQTPALVMSRQACRPPRRRLSGSRLGKVAEHRPDPIPERRRASANISPGPSLARWSSRAGMAACRFEPMRYNSASAEVDHSIEPEGPGLRR